MPVDNGKTEPTEEGVVETPEEDGEYKDAFAEFANAADGGGAPPEVATPTESVEKTDDPPPADPPADPPDIWDGATEAQIAAHEGQQKEIADLQQLNRSISGRQSRLQKQVDDLKSAPPAPPSPSEPPTEEDDPDSAQFRTDYPDIAPQIDKAVDRAVKVVQETVKAEVQPLKDARAEDSRNADIAVLADKHSDWETVGPSPEFRDWLALQPPGVQTMSDSNDPVDVIDVLDRYKARTVQTDDPPPPDPAPETEAEKAAKDKAAAIKARRQKQLDDAVTVTSTDRPAEKPVGTDDYYGAFEAFSGEKDRQTATQR